MIKSIDKEFTDHITEEFTGDIETYIYLRITSKKSGDRITLTKLLLWDTECSYKIVLFNFMFNLRNEMSLEEFVFNEVNSDLFLIYYKMIVVTKITVLVLI